MNFDIFAFVDTWDVSPIEETQHRKLKNRTIEGKSFQFQKRDVRARNRMGASLRAIVDAIMPLLTTGAELYYASGKKDLTEKDSVELIKKFLPELSKNVLSEDMVEFIENLCGFASIWDERGGKGKYKPLTDPMAYESAFDDDMTLQIPVAITVLEVNLSDGFFDKILGALPLELSQIDGSKSGSEQSTTNVSQETETPSPLT